MAHAPKRLFFWPILVAALAACGGRLTPAKEDAADAGPLPRTCIIGATAPAVPLVHIGPDVSIDIMCGGTATVVIASLSNQGEGPLAFTVASDAGDLVFFTKIEGGTLCSSDAVMIVPVQVHPPSAARPGDTFVATYTVSAPGGEFPTGTVRVSARVVAPEFTIEPPQIDFGDVASKQVVRRSVTFRNDTRAELNVQTLTVEAGPFVLDEGVLTLGSGVSKTFGVRVVPDAVGDFEAGFLWKAPAGTGALGPSCTVEKTLALKVRVVEAADASAD